MRRILQISVWLIGLWLTNAASGAEVIDEAFRMQLIKTMAEKGNAGSQYILATMYSKGTGGVLQDDKEAFKWYRLAAEQGMSAAQFNLGVMYENGEGVLQNYKEAVRWFRLAAEQGMKEAQFNLGVMHYTGSGVLEDLVYAHMWFNIAASLGVEKASNNREIASSNMTPSQIEKAQELARQCVKKNYKDC